jgi:hypothetical protein
MAKAKATTKRMTPAEQSERFKQTARELGTDERPEAFDALVRKMAPEKPAKAK